MTLRIVCVAAAGLIACSYARAAEKTMPIKCNEIMSIDQYGFAFNMGGEKETYCEPVNIRTSHDTAPSGTTYMATIAASCYVGSNPNQKTRRTFEFERYKGNIYIKQR